MESKDLAINQEFDGVHGGRYCFGHGIDEIFGTEVLQVVMQVVVVLIGDPTFTEKV